MVEYMKIAVLTNSSRKAGGLFYSVRWLCDALREYECSPVVLSTLNEYSAQDLDVWNQIPVELFRGYGPLKTAPSMRRRLYALPMDLMHLHGIWMDNQRASLCAQKKREIPVVISPRGMLDPWAVQNAAWKKRMVEHLFARESLERATCIHALCRSEAESIRSYGLQNPIAVIPNGVVLPELPEKEPGTEGRKRLLFLGRIHPKKGLKELLQAWSMVQGSQSSFSQDWQLIIAGWDDGGHEPELRKLVGELGIERTVEFPGPAYGADKDALLRSADAFILPSYSEGLPMSVLEAWSYAQPVLITEFCNLAEGFEHNAALHIAPDADSIVEGLNKLFLLDGAGLRALGKNGRQLVEQRFTWRRIAKDMMDVYTWCITGKSPPSCLVIDG